MQAKSKIAVATGVTSLIIAVAALTMAPAGAITDNQMHPPMPSGDTFNASSKVITTTENENKAYVDNKGIQNVSSGNVTVARNDDVSGVGTGNAANNASAKTSVDQSNSTVAESPAIATPAIDDSMDHVTLKSLVVTKVENENKASVDNFVKQNASTGSATVTCNDDVTGDVTTGNASNSLSFDTSVTQSN